MWGWHALLCPLPHNRVMISYRFLDMIAFVVIFATSGLSLTSNSLIYKTYHN